MKKNISDYEIVKQDLKLKDYEIDSHETDLYIKYTKERKDYFKNKDFYVEFFQSQIDKSLWIDIPFYLIDDKLNNRKI
jgi:hypothetical protein